MYDHAELWFFLDCRAFGVHITALITNESMKLYSLYFAIYLC